MDGISSVSGEFFISQELSILEDDDRDENIAKNHTFWTPRESCASLRDRCKVQPVMSRPPDKAKVDLHVGNDEVRGNFIEGIVSLEWNNQGENSQPKGDPDNSGHDINSTDKN